MERIQICKSVIEEGASHKATAVLGPSTANLVSADFSGNGLTSLQPSIVAATGSTSTANVSMNIVEGSVTYDEEVSENEKVQGFASC